MNLQADSHTFLTTKLRLQTHFCCTCSIVSDTEKSVIKKPDVCLVEILKRNVTVDEGTEGFELLH